MRGPRSAVGAGTGSHVSGRADAAAAELHTQAVYLHRASGVLGRTEPGVLARPWSDALTRPDPGARSWPSSPALVERDRQLDAVRRLLASAAAGRGGLVAFVGDPGTGKTALIGEAATLACGFRIARARGSVPERDLPFAYAEQFLGVDALVTRVSGPGGETGGGAGHLIERRAAVFGQARAELRRMSDEGPVLVVLDDLHWADPDSLALIGFLARRVQRLPVAIVAGLRAWPVAAAAAVRNLGAEDPDLALVEPVGALSPEATATLLGTLLARPLDAEVVWRGWAITKGNPMLVVQAARSVALDGRLPPSGGRSTPVLQTALLLRHLAGLPESSLAAARAMSVVGGRAPVGVLKAVAALHDDTVADGIDTLVLAGVLRQCDNAKVAFVHDLLESAVYDDMAPARRRLLHQRAFEAFVALGDPEAAAPHAVVAGLTGHPGAVAVLTQAAERALQAGAVDTGLARMHSAIELAGVSPPAPLLEQYARALFAAGQPAEAYDVWRRVLGGPTPVASRAGVLVGAAQSQAFAGDLDGALAAYDDTVEELRQHGPLPLDLVLERSHVVWELDGPAAALESLDVPLAPTVSLAQHRQLRAAQATFRLHCGDRSGLAELERQAAAALRRLARGDAVAASSHNVLFMYAGACGAVERFDDATAVIDEGTGRFAAQGALWATAPLHIVRIGMLMRRGRPVEALDVLRSLDASGPFVPLLQSYLTAFEAWALAWLGRHDEAAQARAALPPAASLPWMVAITSATSQARHLLVTGRAEAAGDLYAAIAERVVRLGIREPGMLPWAADAAEAWLACGRIGLVERLAANLDGMPAGDAAGSRAAGRAAGRAVDRAAVDRTAARADGRAVDGRIAARAAARAADARAASVPGQRSPVALVWPRVVALAARGGVAAAHGDVEAADRLYGEALALPVVNPLDRAGIVVRYGSWLRRRRRLLSARPLLAEALAVAEAAGAADLAAAARAELTAAGGRRRRSGPEDGTLTAQQARVAELATAGATTREIAQALHVSPRTVETHLAAVYRKLGVRTKAELRRREMAPTP